MPSDRVNNMQFASVIKSISKMEGFYPSGNEPETARLIEALMGIRGKTLALEIGTHFGFTTAHMIRAAYANGSGVFSIDIKDQRSKYLRTLDDHYGYSNQGSHEFLKVCQALGRKFGFVFIDGNHDLRHVEKELNLLENLVEPHCIIAIHDTILFPALDEVADLFAVEYGFTTTTYKTPKCEFKKCDSTGLTVLHRA